MELPLQDLLLMLTQKKILVKGDGRRAYAIQIISLLLFLSCLVLLSFVQRPCEFSKLNAIYTVTPLHFDAFSSKIQATILQLFTSISLHANSNQIFNLTKHLHTPYIFPESLLQVWFSLGYRPIVLFFFITNYSIFLMLL